MTVYYRLAVFGRTDQRVIAYGMLINYGRQVILGNIITLDYFIGLGIAKHSVKNLNNNVTGNTANDFGSFRYYSHTQIGNLPIAFNGGLALGVLLR